MMDAPTTLRKEEFASGMGHISTPLNDAAMMDAQTKPEKEEFA